MAEKALEDGHNDEKENSEIIIEQYKNESQLASVMHLISKDLSEPYSIYTYRYFINNWPRFCLTARDLARCKTGIEGGNGSEENGHDKSSLDKSNHLQNVTRRVDNSINRVENDELNGGSGLLVDSSMPSSSVIDPSIIGSVVCKLDSHKGTNRGYVAMLAVDATYRRQRIATRLVCAAIERMKQDGCEEVVLETEVTNTAALRFYEKLGFLRDKRLYRYYLNGVDALRLKLWLTPADSSNEVPVTDQDGASEAPDSQQLAHLHGDASGAVITPISS